MPEFKSRFDAMSERERYEYLLELLEAGKNEEAKKIIKKRIETISKALENN